MPATKSIDRLLTNLHHNFGDRLSTDPEHVQAVCGDESGLAPGYADGVVWPVSAEEVQTIARTAAETGVALVPRGGGTGKAGACIPHGGLVVDLSRMNRILSWHLPDLYAIVEPGVITAEFDRQVAGHGFLYPPDPASWESCTLGGNIATNAGGPRAVKYGTTQQYVWGLEVVLPGGDVMRFGRLSIKGVAGYDLTSLMVGSEGTLGFITKATLHVVPAPRRVETAWLCFASPEKASRAAEAVFSGGYMPRMMEMMDRTSLDLIRPKTGGIIPEGTGAALLIEVDGDADTTLDSLVRLCSVAAEYGADDTIIARSEKERDGLRRARRLVSSSLKERFPHKLSDDLAVPRSRMVELLERCQELADSKRVSFCAYGHLGDGNLHINLLCEDEDDLQDAERLRLEMIGVALVLGGTVSGEHGIGLAKRDQLPLEQGAAALELQKRLKGVFDPAGIMNPGKVFCS